MGLEARSAGEGGRLRAAITIAAVFALANVSSAQTGEDSSRVGGLGFSLPDTRAAQGLVEKMTLTLKDPEKLKKFIKRNKTACFFVD